MFCREGWRGLRGPAASALAVATRLFGLSAAAFDDRKGVFLVDGIEIVLPTEERAGVQVSVAAAS